MIPELLPVIDHVEITDEGDHLTVWPVWRGGTVLAERVTRCGP